MTWGRARHIAHSAAVTELHERDDRAPRLRDELPQLASLRLHLSDSPTAGRSEILGYTKPVHVATAPARFELHCLEPRCDGYHDLTGQVMDELRNEHSGFAGSCHCNGFVGDVTCGRTLVFRAEASFKPRGSQ